MTDIELLPLPEADGFMETFDTYGCPIGSEAAWGEKTVKETIRANVAQATAAKDAEIEALRAKTAMTMGVGSGDGKLFVHGDYESIKAAQGIVLRAERLEEAGRRVTAAFRAHGEASSFTRQAERTRLECEAAMLALDDALRDHDQGMGNG